MDEEKRCVFVANGETQAQQVCAFLRASGIRPTLRGEALRKTHPVSIGSIGAVEILVPVADEDEARTLLQSAEAGEFQFDDGDEFEPG
jgi:hypothetical protein